MKIRSRAAAAVTAAVALTVSVVAAGGSASAAPGDTPETPIVLTSLADLPAGAVATGSSVVDCATTTTYVLATPAVAPVTHQEYRYQRSVPATYKTETRSAVKRYTPGKDAVAPAKQYQFDKQVQRQKARWVGNTYDNAISYGYAGSYDWRDAGFEPVWSDTTTAPAAPGPVRGEYIHNQGGTWYFTLFYRYVNTGVTRDKPGTGTPATSGSWSSWSPQLNFADGWTGAEPATPPVKVGSGTYADLRWTQTRSVVDQPGYTEYYVQGAASTRDKAAASWITASSLAGWTRFEERTVVDSAGTPAVNTYYSFSDGKVCEVTTPTPTPEPPVVTPPVDEGKSPKASIDTRCTGTTTFRLNNRRTSEVPFRLHGKGYDRTVTVAAGKSKTVKTRLPNRTRAWVKVEGRKWTAVVPNPCPTPPKHTPNTGARTTVR